jgi:hypothetical protein
MAIGKLMRKILNKLDDKTYLSLRYKYATGKTVHWKHPKEFNEKLLWLMVYDHNPKYCTFVDKLEVKKYVAETIGSEYVIPLLAVGDRFEDIDFDSLPNQFVVKCNHDSGGIVICKDKQNFDYETAKNLINSHIEMDFFYKTREWPYKDIKRKVIVEKYMEDHSEDSDGELKDYKFYCFNGVPKFLYISEGLADHKKTKVSYVNLSWENEEFYRKDFKQFDVLPNKPQNYEKMIEIAKKLSEDIPFVRVDLYEIDGKIYFGELTLYPGAGMTELYPDRWNSIIGDYIDITSLKH